MKNTMFYDELQGGLLVSLLTIEFCAHRMPIATSDQELLDALVDALTHTCNVKEPTKEDVEALNTALQSLTKDNIEPTKRGKSMGTSLVKFMSDLEPIEMLGMMTGYDKGRMRALYCRTHFAHTERLIKVFAEHRMESQLADYEATMYANGDKYKDDSGSTVMDANSLEGMAALRHFGVHSFTPEQMEQLGAAPPTV